MARGRALRAWRRCPWAIRATRANWSGQSYGGYGPDRICGAVDYTYNIGKYEVTAGQYTEFLNAVATTRHLRAVQHGHVVRHLRLQDPAERQSRAATRTAWRADWANRPVNYVSWGDAARFANWLHNGQPTGRAGPLDHRGRGVLPQRGDDRRGADGRHPRRRTAKWAIPSEDEWYKAAYHKNDGVDGQLLGLSDGQRHGAEQRQPDDPTRATTRTSTTATTRSAARTGRPPSASSRTRTAPTARSIRAATSGSGTRRR